MSENSEIYKKGWKWGIFLSLSFMVIVIVISVLLFLYNGVLKKSNLVLKGEISDLEKSISEIQENKLVQSYNLISINKKSMDVLKRRSQIPQFIAHIDNISDEYDVEFKGFDYYNGSLTTSVKVDSSKEKLAYEWTVNFIKSYRNKDWTLFDLDFINNFLGQDKISFDIKLDAK